MSDVWTYPQVLMYTRERRRRPATFGGRVMAGIRSSGHMRWEPGPSYRSGRHEVRPQPPHVVPKDTSPWRWLLFIPIVLPLVVPLYNRMDPRLFGLPFFYWCQLGFAGLSTVVVAIVHT